MADVQTTDINTKPAVTAIDSNDQIFISDGGTALKKISYTNLAKAIIEQYNASQLAGATKTIQTAINDLNSKCELTTHGFISNNALLISSSDINSFWFPVFLVVSNIIAVINVRGNSDPTVTILSGNDSLLSVSVQGNGIKIVYTTNSVRGGVILFAPRSALNTISFSEISKQ